MSLPRAPVPHSPPGAHGTSGDFAQVLVQRAARHAPSTLAARLEEEWLADLATRRGALARLRLALGCWWAARVILSESPVVSVAAAGPPESSTLAPGWGGRLLVCVRTDARHHRHCLPAPGRALQSGARSGPSARGTDPRHPGDSAAAARPAPAASARRCWPEAHRSACDCRPTAAVAATPGARSSEDGCPARGRGRACAPTTAGRTRHRWHRSGFPRNSVGDSSARMPLDTDRVTSAQSGFPARSLP